MTEYERVLALETLVDAASLHTVLDSLATVCMEKADHIEENWQDKITARPWKNAATRLEKMSLLFFI